MVSLYHGTTWTRAQRILEEGWQPQDVFGIVNDVAAQFGTQSSVLLEDIRKCGGYMAAEQNRGGHVSFTGSRSNAIWTWAQNAPESRREALWAVWRTQHAHDEESRLQWTKDLDGRQWVLKQLSDDRPALLTVSLTREEWVAAALYPQSVDGQLSLPAELLHALPEIHVRQPFRPRADAVEVEELPRIVDWETFAKMLGLSHDEFVKKADAGEFGVPGSKATPTGYPFEVDWWSLEAVDEILAREEFL
jgi:hypothetical protein